MESEAVAHLVQESADDQLGIRILAANVRHVCVPNAATSQVREVWMFTSRNRFLSGFLSLIPENGSDGVNLQEASATEVLEFNGGELCANQVTGDPAN